MEVGRVVKAHGIRGEVVVSLFTSRVERVAAGSVLYTARPDVRTGYKRSDKDAVAGGAVYHAGTVGTADRAGGSVLSSAGYAVDNALPDSLVVKRSRLTGSKWQASRWIVAFEGVDDRDGAARLAGVVLVAPPVEESGSLWVDDLAGCTVFDAAGRAVGKVAAMLAYPGGDLLELEDGKLIPLVFLVSHEPGRIVVDAPEGLL
ncbi:MAG: ribosome maturation factor RimM [Acidimicrobiales bacterium]